MAMYNLGTLNASQARLDGLVADFSGLDNLESIVNKTLERLKGKASGQLSSYKSGSISKEDFDGYFAELIRVELGKTLGVLRNIAVKKARAAGAGSSSVAVKRRLYKGGDAGNINIATNNRKVSSRKRIVPEPTGGKSGIRRHRTVSPRTKKIREYFGPDRDFILRILESGRDVYYAKPDGVTGRGSKATYGKREAMAPRNWFFHSMKSGMEQAAQQLGKTLIGAVENWVEQQFIEE